MKRIIPLLLVLLLIPCLIVPASATTQDVVDALTNSSGQEWLMGIYNVLVDIRDTITDSLTPIFEDMQARIRSIQGKLSGVFDGESLSVGSLLALLAENMRTAVDYLGWIDSEVSSIETNVVNILQEIYTQGTLTIGESVKGIRAAIVEMRDNFKTGITETFGNVIVSIRGYTSEIRDLMYELVDGDVGGANEPMNDAIHAGDDLDEIGEILSTAPTIPDDSVDSAVSGVNGKFQNITGDADGAVLFGALGEIARGNIFSQLLPTSAMLGVLSFALFGRVF